MLKHPLTGRNSSSPIKGVVFDLDGTLLDTETLSDLGKYAKWCALGDPLSEL